MLIVEFNNLIKLKYSMIFLFLLLTAGCYSSKENIFLRGFILEGFEQYGALRVYNQKSLFDYMNGEAEFYLENGFQNLYLQNYQNFETGAETLVEVYDMGADKGALNIFEEYSKDEGNYLNGFGEVAWTDNYLVLFTRGSFFSRIWPEPASEAEIKPGIEELVDISMKLDMLLIRD